MNIGIDIVDCDRVLNLINEKIFSKNEIEYIHKKNNSLQTIAGIFAAKEAYFKAKGTGILRSKLPEIEVLHHKGGQPYYAHDEHATLSISHTATTAVAVCIIF